MTDLDETTKELQALAQEAYGWFERRERAEGEAFYALKDGRPDWLHELVYAAHGDFGPDDWRYETIHNALGAISDASDGADRGDVSHEFADGHADVYTARGTAWLASNLNRVGYCDAAAEELGWDSERGIAGLIALGQYAEALEVFESVWESLCERLEALEEEAEEAADDDA